MLVKDGQIAQDEFVSIGDGDALPEKAAIVSLKRFLAEKETLLARKHPLGVRLEANESPNLLGSNVHDFAVIVLHVSHFRDGRAFSWSRLLRTRMNYAGEIRISGHFLKDQIAFYARVGANAFEVAKSVIPQDIASAFTEISQVYQPSVDGRATILDLRAQKTAATPS